MKQGDNPFIEQHTTADRNILVVVVIELVAMAIGVYDTANRLGQEQYFYDSIVLYYLVLGFAFLILGAYGTYQLWRKQRMGWIIITGLTAYGLVSSLFFWVPYLMSLAGFDLFDYGGFDIPEIVISTVLAYLVANAIQLYLLVQEDVRERLQISTAVLTNTLVVSMVALVANQLITYVLNNMF